MKLLAKYSRINLLVTIVIFLVSSAAYYFLLSYILLNQIDEDLKIEEEEINTYVAKYTKLPESISVSDQIINYTVETAPFTNRHFATVEIPEAGHTETEDFRQLVFGFTVQGRHYKAIVSKSLEDTDALIHSILLITFLTILLILMASFVINRWVLKRIWRPFYFTLNKINNFKLGKNEKFVLPGNQVDEFSLMNQTVEKLINQAQVDYLSLKTFSENASHEIQTPLAVIRSKLDMLIQDADLTEKQSTSLQGVYLAVEKLARLNQSLLLLTRIENNQFAEKHVVNLQEKLEEKISEFQELWQSQEISITSTLQPTTINMNEELIEILLNNLLSNATKYNYKGGAIDLTLSAASLTIANTSDAGELDQNRLFQRFYKTTNTSDRNGLGLSIIKQICEDSGFVVRYSYHSMHHTFSISFHAL
jgi:signal transduction histidine kinase